MVLPSASSHDGRSNVVLCTLFFCSCCCLGFFFFFFSGTGVWTQGLILTRQALSYLSHIPRTFCFTYFPNSLEFISRLRSSYLCFPCSWDNRHTPSFLLVEWGLMNFLPGPASNRDPPMNHCAWPLWGLFCKGVSTIMKAPPSWPNHLLKALTLSTIILTSKFQHRNFEEDTNI
jgi:hypothetical protein